MNDVIPKSLAGEIAASTSATPAQGEEPTFAKAREAALAASAACEAASQGDSDSVVQNIEQAIRSFAGVLRDYRLDLVEVLPQEQCAECGRITADARLGSDSRHYCPTCSELADGAGERRSSAVLVDARHIVGERGDTYGDAPAFFARVARLWSVILDRDIRPSQVATMMALFKVARTAVAPAHRDSYVDAAAYAALAYEAEAEVA